MILSSRYCPFEWAKRFQYVQYRDWPWIRIPGSGGFIPSLSRESPLIRRGRASAPAVSQQPRCGLTNSMVGGAHDRIGGGTMRGHAGCGETCHDDIRASDP